MLTVSCRLLTRKCFGNPSTPLAGMRVDIMQFGQAICLDFVFLFAHLFKHSSQNECWHGNTRGFLKASRHMPHLRKLMWILSASDMLVAILSNLL